MTTSRADDTVLDQLAAQVRAFPPLADARVATLLAAARSDPGGAAVTTLLEHHLGVALEGALKRGSPREALLLDLTDLFQEGSAAMVPAIAEYARQGRPARGLRTHLQAVVAEQLDAALAEATRLREADAGFVQDSRLLEVALGALRDKLSREPTDAEVAAALSWDGERVGLMKQLVAAARAAHDESLLPYLDDLE